MRATCALVSMLLLLSGCGSDPNAEACQAIKDDGLFEIAGPRYDEAGKSLQNAIDKAQDARLTDFQGQVDIQDLNDLCAKYGVRDVWDPN